MRKILLIILPVLVLSLASCVSSKVRYSPSEISKFSPQVQEHIKNSEVALGMPIEAVRYSWGSPNRVNILPPDDQGNLREEWVYTSTGWYGTRIVFTEGKVTGIISGMMKKKFNLFKKSDEEEKEKEPAGE